jgi:hypothetical protein
MKQAMTNYRITSQPWQLKAAAEGTLGTIILPLVPEIENSPDGWRYWSFGSYEATLAFAPDDIPFSYPGSYAQLQYQKGDRIYLAEKWCKGNLGAAFDDDIYFVESTTPEAEHIGWQPAETMPEEAARYWFEVGDVRVVQMSDIDRHLCDRAALTDISSDLPCGVEEWASILMRWNAAHPDYPWDADRWVIVLDLNIIGETNGRNA